MCASVPLLLAAIMSISWCVAPALGTLTPQALQVPDDESQVAVAGECTCILLPCTRWRFEQSWILLTRFRGFALRSVRYSEHVCCYAADARPAALLGSLQPGGHQTQQDKDMAMETDQGQSSSAAITRRCMLHQSWLMWSSIG